MRLGTGTEPYALTNDLSAAYSWRKSGELGIIFLMPKFRGGKMRTRLFTILMILVCVISLSAQPGLKEKKQSADGPDLLAGLQFRPIGPAFMSGRISDIAIDHQNRKIWYVAVGSGGVWKTVNGGITFFPIFDDQGSYSIGCVTIDPRDSQVIWVGTGENISGRHVAYGDGVYRSQDGGRTWKNMGLKNSEHIDKILVDPRDSNTVYVAAEGPLWSSGGDRGVYKTTDGGKTWTAVLTVDADTGATDLVMHPHNPDILFAATHQRRRHVSAYLGGGPGSGIWKSVDAGKSWVRLKNGLPGEDLGMIALAISPQRPEVLYASLETSIRTITFYRSDDGGSSWTKGASYVTPGTGAHFYQELFACPHRFDRIYSMEINILVSDDGGKNWDRIPEGAKHGDNHALAFDPANPDYLLCGSDGGLYETHDSGKTWRYVSNLPVTQFYRVAVDNDLPFYNIVGGTQDNCTQYGPSQTIRRDGVFSTDWSVILGGDGYTCQIDPKDPDTVYAEAQVGYLARYHSKTGDTVMIRPSVGPDEEIPRFNWDSPLIISAHDSKRLYFASQRLYRSDDRGDSWTAVSPDLSKGINRLSEEFMGRRWSVNAVWDNDAMSYYSNIVTISESPVLEGLIYCGTDDGLVQRTDDGGKTWIRMERFPGVPHGTFVQELMASRHERDVVYALFNNHQRGDFKPYILKSSDRGRSWQSLSANLPERHVLWAVEQDHVNRDLLFLGSEFGVFFSLDGGRVWEALKGGMPVIAVRDIRIQERENDLVCATFGRGIYILENYSFLRDLQQSGDSPFYLFPVPDGRLFTLTSPLGGGRNGTQGDTFYAADNPPFGVTFTYRLQETVKGLKDLRRQDEKKKEKAGQSVDFPGWDRLREEMREIPPGLEWVIEDSQGRIVRRLFSEPKAGVQRLTWDLREASMRPVKLNPPPPSPFTYSGYGEGRGPLVLPGDYFVSVYQAQGSERTLLSERNRFRCGFLGESPLDDKQLAELKAYRIETTVLRRRISAYPEILSRMRDDLEILRLSLKRASADVPKLWAGYHRLRGFVLDLGERLSGDTARTLWAEPLHDGLMGRAQRALSRGGLEWQPLTKAQKEYLLQVSAEESAFHEDLKKVLENDFQALMSMSAAANCPWVPGFGLVEE